jgi:hypothetical protein
MQLNQSTSTSAGPMQQVVCIALAESFDMGLFILEIGLFTSTLY